MRPVDDPVRADQIARLFIENTVLRLTNQRNQQQHGTVVDRLDQDHVVRHNQRLQSAIFDLLGDRALAHPEEDAEAARVVFGYLRSRGDTIGGGTIRGAPEQRRRAELNLPKDPSATHACRGGTSPAAQGEIVMRLLIRLVTASVSGQDAGMSFDEAPEHRLLRETIAKVCQDFDAAYFQEKASSDEPMDELWRALARAGLIGVNLPEDHGGGGGGISKLAIVCEETAAAGVPLLLLLVSSAICGEILKSHGTAAQHSRWLPPMASGQDKMAFAITGPDAGSNTHRLSPSHP